MNQRHIETMTMKALDILASGQPDIFTPRHKIPSKYMGYVSGFGPCVSQAGLIQTIAFFSRMDGEGKDRRKIIDLMQRILVSSGYLATPQPNERLLKQINRLANEPGRPDIYQLKTLVMEAAVACKLAMRTFPKEEE